jgi:Rrf2 family iron-sulfur cluster assembly transcriptional regulator
MLDLALNTTQGPVSLSDISRRQTISLSYLEQLFSKLRQANLVKSVRGPGGGYLLNRSVESIYVANIIDAVNENIDVTNCSGDGNCDNGEVCLTHHLWNDLSLQIHDFLSAISLSSLIERKEIQGIANRQRETVEGLLDQNRIRSKTVA